MKPHDKLIHNLFIELFQTERAADVHSMREAERYGTSAPSLALRRVADHARAIRADLLEIARARKIADTSAGSMLGSLFSAIREGIADRLISAERSYRATLLGMRHGVDLVRSLRSVAHVADDVALVVFCDGWMAQRAPLVDEVANAMMHFAKNPERAMARANQILPDAPEPASTPA